MRCQKWNWLLQKDVSTETAIDLQIQPITDIPVMTEEDYLSSKGYPASGFGEAALHKRSSKDCSTTNKNGGATGRKG